MLLKIVKQYFQSFLPQNPLSKQRILSAKALEQSNFHAPPIASGSRIRDLSKIIYKWKYSNFIIRPQCGLRSSARPR